MVGLMGPAGAGQLTKMVNQICIAGLVQGLAEGIHFAKRAGLDVEKVIGVISKGAAQSWQMENRYKTMNAGKFDFGFAVDWMRKDLAICTRRGARQRREAAGHRARRSVLCRGAGDGRQALGHVEPDRAAGAGLTREGARNPASRRQAVIAELRALGSEKNRAGMARFGINTERAFGISMASAAAAGAASTSATTSSRWRCGRAAFHEARLLAALIDDPKQVTPTQMDAWAADFDSWDLCDQACMKLFVKDAVRRRRRSPNGRRTSASSCVAPPSR